MTKDKIFGWLGLVFSALFVVFTVCVKVVDVSAVGPNGSEVGFSYINASVRDFVGENAWAYLSSEILGFACFAVVAFFVTLGVIQLCKNKSVVKVDKSILALCGLYVVTFGFYILFEIVTINFRPILEDGELAASYPSSHTLLATVVYLSAFFVSLSKLEGKKCKWFVAVICIILAVLTGLFRALSGVHWLTDIIGSILLSVALVCVFVWVKGKLEKPKQVEMQENNNDEGEGLVA